MKRIQIYTYNLNDNFYRITNVKDLNDFMTCTKMEFKELFDYIDTDFCIFKNR